MLIFNSVCEPRKWSNMLESFVSTPQSGTGQRFEWGLRQKRRKRAREWDVPHAPLSRAMSHTFSQLPSGWTAIALTWSKDGHEAASSKRDLASRSRISFFIIMMLVTSGDWMIKDVYLVPKRDSKNLHCRTKSRDSTSEAARVRKTRELMLLTPETVLWRYDSKLCEPA